MRNRVFKLVVLLVFAMEFTSPGGIRAASGQEKSEADRATKRLWSANKSERDAAKETLLALKADAVKPLLHLLDDLIFNDRQRYATGMEKDGDSLFQELRKSRASGDRARTQELATRLSHTEISQRLESDVCELLGQLKSAAAVPLLIRMIGRRPAFFIGSGSRTHLISPASSALIQIGRPAVPNLVEAIYNADRLASESVSRCFIWLDIQPAKGLANVIRYELAATLGDIGDVAALPALKMLAEDSSDSEVKSYTWEAVRKINQKITYLSGAEYLRIFCFRFGRLTIMW